MVCVIYAGPLFLVKNERKKLKHFRFSVYIKGKVNYSNIVILINLLLLFKKTTTKKQKQIVLKLAHFEKKIHPRP